MSHPSKEYLLGSSEAEFDRLAYQHQIWSHEAAKLWRSAGFGRGSSVLDIGCGPGYATLDLAHLVGAQGHVHALDASERFLDYLRKQIDSLHLHHVTPHQGDVHHLPLKDGAVDGAFARWVLCFVRDPAAVVKEAFRVLRSGGALTVMDYFNYLAVGMFPERESFQRLFESYHRSVVDAGGSYDVGNALPGALSGAGFRVTTLDPICRIARANTREWIWLRIFTDGFVPTLVDQGYMTAEEQEELNRDWDDLSGDPNAFFFTPPMMGIVARKP